MLTGYVMYITSREVCANLTDNIHQSAKHVPMRRLRASDERSLVIQNVPRSMLAANLSVHEPPDAGISLLGIMAT